MNINNILNSYIPTSVLKPKIVEEQTLCSPVPDKIVSDTSDFENFETLAKYYYVDQNDNKLKAAIPLLNLLQDNIINFLEEVASKDPSIYKKILEKESACEDFQNEFFITLDLLKKSNNPEKIVRLFNRIIIHTESVWSHYKPLLEHFIVLFQSQRLDLFMQPSAYFIRSELKFSSQELYRVAVKSTQYLSRALISLHYILLPKCIQRAEIQYSSIIDKLKLINPLISCSLQSNKFLSHGQKININVAFSHVLGKLLLEESILDAGLKGLLEDIPNYFNTTLSNEADKISLINENPRKNSQDYNQRYVQDNFEIYENFIPRVEEIHDNLITSSQKAIKYSGFLKNFLLYLEFGDMEKLKKRLDEKSSPSQLAIETILLEEVRDFSSTLKEIPILKKVISYLKDEKLAPLNFLRDVFQKDLSIMEKIVSVTQAALAGPLEFAKKCEKNLFIQPVHANRSLKSEGGVTKKKGGKSKVSDVIEQRISNQCNIISSPEITSIASTNVSSCEPVSFAAQLDQLRSFLSKEFFSPKNTYKGLGTKEALLNAKAHLNDLLCVFGRIIRLSDPHFSPRDLHAFVIDAVRHSILASEQMLAALVRESCMFKSEEELWEHHSHSFPVMLAKCKFKAGVLHHSLRSWAGEVSRGEIIVRNLDQCQLDNGSLQNLLAKLNYLMSGNKTFTAEEIFSKTMEFCKNSAVFCGAIQKQINFFYKNEEQISFNSFLEPFQQFLPLEGLAKWDRIETSPDILLPQISNLESCRKLIENLKVNLQSRRIANNLDNVINHLFFHLETEVAASKGLNLIMIHLHCQNVLLLPQLIVKEVLLNLISISQNFSNPHELDVWSLVQMLEIDIKYFNSVERQFLQDGKSIRQIARYPYSYSSKQAKDASLISLIQKLLKYTQSLQNKEKFSNDYKFEEGYQIDPKLKRKINYIHKTLEEYLKIGFKVLEKIVSIYYPIISKTQTM
jgi:hypothetical protein